MARRVQLPLDMITLQRGVPTTLHRQLYASLRAHILDGRLPARTRLPSTRELASDLSVSRNTIIAAYDALIAEGYLESLKGSGTRVAGLPARTVRERLTGEERLPDLSTRGQILLMQPPDRTVADQIAFHPGCPEIDAFPFAVWSRLVNLHIRRVKEDLFGYHLVGGHPRLLTALAKYLSVSRGVNCDPEQVIVVTGAQAALDLVARLFMDPGDNFWMEDPGYHGAYSAFLGAGGRPVPLRVEPSGWQFDPQDSARPRLIFVTPSCQWPLGMVMPMDVRLRLLEIAERHDAWIIEDDYDSEYRFRGHPVPAMQGLDDSGRVIYVGTLSKTMFPSIRVAYLVVPKTLVAGFRSALNVTGQHPPLFLQAALADFISEGFFSTHLKRMRRLYARRMQDLVARCRERLGPWLTVEQRDTGMQVAGWFTQPLDDGIVLAAARRRAVDFARISSHYRFSQPRHGLFLGYAGVDREHADRGVERLRMAFEDIDPHRRSRRRIKRDRPEDGGLTAPAMGAGDA